MKTIAAYINFGMASISLSTKDTKSPLGGYAIPAYL
jgi:hypothetical protein